MKQIYVIKNIINDLVYVGQAASAYDRFRRHRNNHISADKQDLKIVNAMKNLGANNFYYEILENCADEDADEKEKYYISKFNSFKNGYNGNVGGVGAKNYTEEDIKECYELLMNGSTIREIEIVTGINRSTLKRELEKIVPNYNTVVNMNMKKARVKSAGTPVNQYDMEGNFIRRYSSVREALESLGVSVKTGSIANCCKHRPNYHTAYGYKWEYATEGE